jgi:hypothetical protein
MPDIGNPHFSRFASFDVYFSINLQCTPSSSKLSHKPLHAFFIIHACYIPRLEHPNDKCRVNKCYETRQFLLLIAYIQIRITVKFRFFSTNKYVYVDTLTQSYAEF